MIEADFAIMHKTRPAHDLAAVTEITGRVSGKIAIVGDDVIMTGGTLLANVKACKSTERRRSGCSRHTACSATVRSSISGRGLAGIVVTDTVPIDPLSAGQHDRAPVAACSRRRS